MSEANEILIVDDTPANLRLLSEVLVAAGYRARPVISGAQALRAAAAAPPALILLDIHMPEPDGYEVCRRLKADPATRDVPVIFLSALNEVIDKVRAFEVGGVDYVTKPFHIEEVLARVRTHLTIRALQDELKREREKSDALLYRMLPAAVAGALREGRSFGGELFPAVTVLFADIVGFTALARARGARQIFELLDRLYTSFDALSERHGLYKVETIGDCYVVVGGVPEARPGDADAVAAMALDMIEAVHGFDAGDGVPLEIRIGIDSGPVIGGVVGSRTPRFCLLGDAMNAASRLERASVPMLAHVSDRSAALLDRGRFHLRSRGSLTLKGLGVVQTHFLERVWPGAPRAG
ncbi:MAG: response regulator [Nannocystis sp.]|nr:response regulator [Nannocystis sp.]